MKSAVIRLAFSAALVVALFAFLAGVLSAVLDKAAPQCQCSADKAAPTVRLLTALELATKTASEAGQ